MYHPQEVDLPFPNYDDREAAEVFELKNNGMAATDISGWCFIGVDFCFPSGTTVAANAIITLVKDAVVFQNVYGFTADYEYEGKLSNSGEELALLDASGNTIQNIDFSDSYPWPDLADGLGYSLELTCSNCDTANPYNWKTANHPNGHTAGNQNSYNASADLPSIQEVSRNVSKPDPGQSVQISATIENSTNTQLEYAVNFGPIQLANLVGSVNNVYVFEIPGFTDGDLVLYNIIAGNSQGTSLFPRADSNSTKDGYVIKNNIVSPSNFPVVNWHFNGVANIAESVIEHEGNIVSNSDV